MDHRASHKRLLRWKEAGELPGDPRALQTNSAAVRPFHYARTDRPRDGDEYAARDYESKAREEIADWTLHAAAPVEVESHSCGNSSVVSIGSDSSSDCSPSASQPAMAFRGNTACETVAAATSHTSAQKHHALIRRFVQALGHSVIRLPLENGVPARRAPYKHYFGRNITVP